MYSYLSCICIKNHIRMFYSCRGRSGSKSKERVLHLNLKVNMESLNIFKKNQK